MPESDDSYLPARATSRRALTHGVVWSVPVASVAAAAPAFAASSCGQRLDWDLQTTGQVPPATITVAGVAISRTMTSVAGGVLDAANNTVVASPRGGVNEKALALAVSLPTPNAGLSLTLNFAPAVYDLRFSVFDIDRVAVGGWQDRVTPSGTYTEPVARGSNVVLQTGTFTATTDLNVPANSAAGNITLLYAGPVSQVTLTYVCGANFGGTNMAVFLSDLTFCLNP